MNLAQAQINQSYVVCDILLNEKMRRRLEILGLTIGSTVIIIRRKSQGAMIVRVRGTRFAIGVELAKGLELVKVEVA